MKKLKVYMRKNKLTYAEMGKRVGCNYGTIYGWARGITQPGVVHAVKLEKVTQGAVSVYDWK